MPFITPSRTGEAIECRNGLANVSSATASWFVMLMAISAKASIAPSATQKPTASWTTPELVGRGRRIDRRGVDRSGGRPTPVLWLAA